MWLRRIFKSGDGLALILPQSYCRDQKIMRGDYIECRVAHDGSLIIQNAVTGISKGADRSIGDSSKPPNHAPSA